MVTRKDNQSSTRKHIRLGEFDAQKLKEGFKHFDASDLQSLGTGEALVRLGRSDFDFNLMTLVPNWRLKRTPKSIGGGFSGDAE